MVIVDECHHVPAVSFEQVMKAVRSRSIYGLTATPKRQDGHHPILNMYAGMFGRVLCRNTSEMHL